ncbi:hypothetical protein LPTSP4_36230 [Leptospira ryugenii]|uniref:Uncharacterized protein n=1 Tax=Leptospira ryugenii TaxID=1917863 RepID=A0A2P2E5C1_9LEPT|nr:hypothetical protein [Leptospira ryugenii]GBF52085.1 hypothetical protein LPTSP4_36230 [Leptospira ryugenii]
MKLDYIEWKELSLLIDGVYDLTYEFVKAHAKSIEGYLLQHTNLSEHARQKLTDRILRSQYAEMAKVDEFPRSLLFQKEFILKDYYYWDDELFQASYDFREEFRIYPNIVILNTLSMRKIELITNNLHKDKVKNESGMKLSETSEFALLEKFSAENFELKFAIDESLETSEFVLIFDTNPLWRNQDHTK